jgi:hypothetical protein
MKFVRSKGESEDSMICELRCFLVVTVASVLQPFEDSGEIVLSG